LLISYLDRFDKEGLPSLLAPVDFFVSTVDPMKEPPLVTANTVLSILAVDYPVDKVSCYVSDDGAAMLTFEALSETSEFAKKWVPFCKKYSIEPRAPEWYFQLKIDYLRDKVAPNFVRERRAMKVRYLVSFNPCYSTLSDIHYANLGQSYYFSRESMRNSRSESMPWLLKPKRFLRKDGQCRMGLHGLETMFVIILE